ncbi:hypothetical protein Tco_0679549 [Tanacetum coccineum]|uniref:Uncharacterized protein n=1 Tax=Tanacetum coccineum TaxID=301880 RepID=A0ABQ4XIW6_9ASTR
MIYLVLVQETSIAGYPSLVDALLSKFTMAATPFFTQRKESSFNQRGQQRFEQKLVAKNCLPQSEKLRNEVKEFGTILLLDFGFYQRYSVSCWFDVDEFQVLTPLSMDMLRRIFNDFGDRLIRQRLIKVGRVNGHRRSFFQYLINAEDFGPTTEKDGQDCSCNVEQRVPEMITGMESYQGKAVQYWDHIIEEICHGK